MTHLDPSLSLFCPFSNCHLQVAKKAGIPVGSAKNVIIWGNHSSAQFPDVQHAQVYKNSPAFDGHQRPGLRQGPVDHSGQTELTSGDRPTKRIGNHYVEETVLSDVCCQSGL